MDGDASAVVTMVFEDVRMAEGRGRWVVSRVSMCEPGRATGRTGKRDCSSSHGREGRNGTRQEKKPGRIGSIGGGWQSTASQSKQTKPITAVSAKYLSCHERLLPSVTCRRRRRRRPSNSGVCDPRRGILTPCHAQPPVNNCVSTHGPRT